MPHCSVKEFRQREGNSSTLSFHTDGKPSRCIASRVVGVGLGLPLGLRLPLGEGAGEASSGRGALRWSSGANVCACSDL